MNVEAIFFQVLQKNVEAILERGQKLEGVAHTHTYANTHTHTHMRTRVCMCTYTHTPTNRPSHAITHTHTHTHLHTHLHTHTDLIMQSEQLSMQTKMMYSSGTHNTSSQVSSLVI